MNNVFADIIRYWIAGGPLVAPIMAVCFLIWFYFLKTRSALSALSKCFAETETRMDAVIKTDLTGVNNSTRAAGIEQTFDIISERCMTAMSRDFIILAALTASAPLLGLLGTVLGMIRTFQAAAGETGKMAGSIAEGISQALITTQIGLASAIPGVFGLAGLRRRRDQARIHFAVCRTRLRMAFRQA